MVLPIMNQLLLLFLAILVLTEAAPKTQHVTATKGKFFVHTLHSAYFFPSTVKVRWEATLHNKPALPSWMSLLPSRHPEIAYLVGTPVTTAGQITLHIISKRIDNFEIQQQMLVITLIDDAKFHGSTKQTLDITVKNMEVEEFVGNRKKQIDQLEALVRNTFRGKGVNPYIAEVRPEFVIPLGKEHIFKDKPGTVVSIGTQKTFFPATVQLVQNLQQNLAFCKRSNQVAMNKFFAPVYTVDWCQTQLKNISGTIEEAFSKRSHPLKETRLRDLNVTPEPPAKEVYGYDGYNFWNSVVLFPAIGILCVVLLLILSVIFFGSREGQKWRDYKTSVEKLEEYISVRESQKHLRELSVQRQLVSMSQERKAAPTGIHLFLQPRATYRSSTSIARLSKSASRLNDKESSVLTEHIPVGKQTVAEAAKQRGSSMHLYRNPLDSESNENDSDNSLDEQQFD